MRKWETENEKVKKLVCEKDGNRKTTRMIASQTALERDADGE